MKRFIILAMAVVLLFAPSFPSAGIDTHLKIYDYADLFTDEEEDALMAKAQQVADTYRMDLVVVTTNDTEGKGYIEYAGDFYYQNGFGYGPDDDGILFLIDMESGMPWFSFHGKSQGVVGIDDVISSARAPYYDGRYYDAALTFLERVEYYLANPEGYNPEELFRVDTSLKVYDDADLFTDAEEESLRERAQRIARDRKTDVVVVTTWSTFGVTSMEYADDFFDYGGFGYGYDRDGILFLIDMENRIAWISTSGRAIKVFYDKRIDKILDKVEGHLRADRFYEAANVFLDKTEYYLSSGFEKSARHIPVYLAISFAVAAISVGVMAAHNRGRKTVKADTYLDPGSLRMRDNRDVLIRKAVTRTVISSSGGSSRGSGTRSSTHTSRSGRTHGGGGRSFR